MNFNKQLSLPAPWFIDTTNCTKEQFDIIQDYLEIKYGNIQRAEFPKNINNSEYKYLYLNSHNHTCYFSEIEFCAMPESTMVYTAKDFINLVQAEYIVVHTPELWQLEFVNSKLPNEIQLSTKETSSIHCKNFCKNIIFAGYQNTNWYNTLNSYIFSFEDWCKAFNHHPKSDALSDSNVTQSPDTESIQSLSSIKRPPLGLVPKKYHDIKVNSDRFIQVCTAITRYYNEGLPINIEWITEYNQLVQLDYIKEKL